MISINQVANKSIDPDRTTDTATYYEEILIHKRAAVSRILCAGMLCVLVTDDIKLDNVSALHIMCRYCT